MVASTLWGLVVLQAVGGTAEFRYAEENVEDFPGKRKEQKCVVLQQAEGVLGQWKELERMNVGSSCFHGCSRHVGPHRPFLTLSGNRFGNQECIKEASWACPRLFPCPASRPRPDHSRAPAAEVEKRLERQSCLISKAFRSSQVEGSQGGSSW